MDASGGNNSVYVTAEGAAHVLEGRMSDEAEAIYERMKAADMDEFEEHETVMQVVKSEQRLSHELILSIRQELRETDQRTYRLRKHLRRAFKCERRLCDMAKMLGVSCLHCVTISDNTGGSICYYVVKADDSFRVVNYWSDLERWDGDRQWIAVDKVPPNQINSDLYARALQPGHCDSVLAAIAAEATKRFGSAPAPPPPAPAKPE